ncbi:MAG TPA: ATP-binding protein [Pyrinomonadaceae bacterium]|nr:ATP-binding protein [Pyrinomonadaceae bacterium]
MKEESVINALVAAIENDPADVSLRLHVASLLLADGDAAAAWEHLKVALEQAPDNREALTLAAQAADLLGRLQQATAYRRLSAALLNETRSAKKDDDEDEEILFEYDDSRQTPASVSTIFGDSDQRVDSVLDETDEIWEFEDPGFRLADVAGMDDVKQRLELAFLGPMKNPKLMNYFGKRLRGGLLLYGPPGCGKTFIARATAGELGAKFLSVGLSDVLDMWLGNSEQNLHQIFERARRKSPCVLFFDEIDALGRKRSLVRHSAISGVVNQLLAELDSVGSNNEGVFVLAATNHPWDVDTALRRPGRLDRMLLVLPPDKPAREAILRFHLRERPVDKIDLGAIAKQTEGFSGADLAHLCESAAELAMNESMRLQEPRPIRMDDFNQALHKLRPSARAWFETARNFALFANEGGIYDELLDYLKRERLL